MTDQTFGGDTTNPDRDVNPNNQNTLADSDSKNDLGLSREEIEQIVKRDRHAQEHIKKLEDEAKAYRDMIAEYEDKVKESTTVETLMERMQQASATRNEEPTTPKVDVDDLISAAEERVLSSLSAREREEREVDNFNTAVEQLKSVYQDKYAEVVRDRANELGMSIEDMDRLAKNSPKALVELVRGEQKTNRTAPSSSSVNTGVNFGDPTDLSYFSKLRKEDPKSFYSSDVQKQYRQAILAKARKEGRL